MENIDRLLLERYLAFLHATFGGRVMHRHLIGQLNQFLTAIRQHDWDTTLPVNAMFFPEDYPKEGEWLPRALSDHVMAQLEHTDNLDRWTIPAYRLVTVILMRGGLRVIDALGLAVDCVVRDSNGAPYLRYFNHKMRREALVPIDDELEQSIAQHLKQLKVQWPQGVPRLFPKPRNNADGRLPMSGSAYRRALQRWLASCAIQDEHGQQIRITPHQWRHTLGTQLINRDVPQEVVRRILDHDSHMMTARYARLSDTTIRRHWESARKVGNAGQTVTLDPDGPLAEAAWAKQRVSRATQALPNGYCSLPLVKTCPHANACLTCPMFVTTAEFLPQHRHQQKQVIELISSAEARGQQRLAEMNRQVLGNLTSIITALETDPDTAAEEAPNAS
ncbi:site-specific integrase [Nocardia sp. NPDC047038]|uniref:tyrosine-type recombinase/integrase n=1 Tax=Nocardia sp. NPDC047038 TaxID=3154338 RepID=UPI0033DBEC09